jgi:hypothetical protein
MSANNLITLGVVALGVWYFFGKKTNVVQPVTVSGGAETPQTQMGVMVDYMRPMEDTDLL